MSGPDEDGIPETCSTDETSYEKGTVTVPSKKVGESRTEFIIEEVFRNGPMEKCGGR